MRIPNKHELIKSIEEGAIWGDLLLASSSQCILHRLQRLDEINNASQNINYALFFEIYILGRLRCLLNQCYQDNIAHPQRTSIAAYLYILRNTEDGQFFIQEVINSNRQDLPLIIDFAKLIKCQDSKEY